MAIIWLISIVALSSCTPLVPSESAAEEATVIDSCKTAVQRPGVYALIAASDQAEQVCSFKISAEYDEHIKITVLDGNGGCSDDSLIQIADGWLMTEHRRAILWPVDTELRSLCLPNKKRQRTSLVSKRNVAEVFYRYVSDEQFVKVHVEFIKTEKPCNILLTTSFINQLVTIKSQEEAVNCELRLPGEIVLDMDTELANTDECIEGGSTVKIKIGAQLNEFPSEETTCTTGTESFLLPCKHTAVAVHFSGETGQSVQLKFRPANQRTAMAHSELCY